MKFGLSIVLSLGLALSPLCALDSKRAVANTSLSSADAEFLFTSNANLNVVALSDEEMQKTEGESLLAIFGAGVFTGVVACKITKILFKAC